MILSRLRRRVLLAFCSVAVVSAHTPSWGLATERPAYTPKINAGPHRVIVELGEWRDAARGGRVVPWKLYRPDVASAPVPVVVWSHGGGGDREGARYLGEHLASHGYAALHIQHAGSDRDAFRNNRAALLAGVNDPTHGEPRFRDLQFVVRETRRMAAGPWRGVIDPDRMGISGHSFGAITVQIAAGQAVKGFGQQLAEPHFKAGFIMSPSPPRAGYDAGPEAFSDMLMPLFHLTGTQDASPADDFPVEARRQPFARISDVHQMLVVFNGANHMTFSGETRALGRDWSYPSLPRHVDLIKAAAVAFWDVHLRGDQSARVWLERGGYAEAVAEDGAVEIKRAKR